MVGIGLVFSVIFHLGVWEKPSTRSNARKALAHTEDESGQAGDGREGDAVTEKSALQADGAVASPTHTQAGSMNEYNSINATVSTDESEPLISKGLRSQNSKPIMEWSAWFREPQFYQVLRTHLSLFIIQY